MPFITQTPISDQIQNGQLPASYSKYDRTGEQWDSLKNYNTKNNLKPSTIVNLPDTSRIKKSYSSYDTIGKLWDSSKNYDTKINLKPSDSISRIGILPNYSSYDLSGKLWDSLKNYSIKQNIKPSNGIGSPAYSVFDTVGTKWDSLRNPNYNIEIDTYNKLQGQGFSKNTNKYKDLEYPAALREGSLTPISNKINIDSWVITNVEFSQWDTTVKKGSGILLGQQPYSSGYKDEDYYVQNKISRAEIAADSIYNGMSKQNYFATGVMSSRFESRRFSETKKYSETRLSNFIGLNEDNGTYNAFAYTGTLTGVENPREKYDTIYRNVALSGQLLQGGLAQANGLISTNLGLSVNTSDISKAINPQASYELLNYDQLYSTKGLGYQDFRNFKTSGLGRLDGTTSLALSGFKSKGSAKLISLNATAIASAQLMNNIGHKGHFRTNGTYNLFNQQTYFGMGIQDEPGVLRNDFTAGTEATKIIRNGELVTPNALKVFPFRGDKVTVRDYVKNDYTEIYNWRSSKWNSVSNNSTGFAKAVTAIKNFLGNQRNLTKDFIKFHFTGPNAHPGQGSQPDDLFVFRANINSLNDSFQPSWTPIETLGRADSNWIYTSFQRSLDLSFSVYATSRDELRPMWRKLNYLATYTMPTYNSGAPTYRGNFLRITIGDLFISQPVFITSLTYTLADQETTWEINIEEDENMKQVPQKIEVNMGLQFIGDQIPKKDMSAYNLHLESQYSPDGQYKQQNGNWLADAKYPETQDFINSILQGNSPVDIPTSGPGSDADIERGIEISQGLRAR